MPIPQPPNDRQLLTLRFLYRHTLAETALLLDPTGGISRERVRQWEWQALARLRDSGIPLTESGIRQFIDREEQ